MSPCSSISVDGTRIAFYSYADNFSAIDENTVPNTFVHDTETTDTTLVSRATGGGAAGDGESVNPAISVRVVVQRRKGNAALRAQLAHRWDDPQARGEERTPGAARHGPLRAHRARARAIPHRDHRDGRRRQPLSDRPPGCQGSVAADGKSLVSVRPRPGPGPPPLPSRRASRRGRVCGGRGSPRCRRA
jgi:hypothetical protein